MNLTNHLANTSFAFLSGGGEMSQRIREYDWSKTALGPIEAWPQSLRTTLGIILHARFPMFLFWGHDHLCFYNDAYRPSLGNNGKHPSALGQKGADVWLEIWDVIFPQIDNIMKGGNATGHEDQLLPIYRNGKIENVYWTYSYSPVLDEKNQIVGVFVTCNETTDQVENRVKLEKALEALRTSEDRYQNFITQSTEGIYRFELECPMQVHLSLEDQLVHFNKHGYMAECNDAMAHMYGYQNAHALIGMRLSDFFPDDPDTKEYFSYFIRSGYRIENAESKEIDKQGQTKYFSNNLVGIIQDGVLVRGWGTQRDITAQRAAEEKIRQNQELLQAALEGGELGFYDFYPQAGNLIWSPKTKALFGLPPDADVDYNIYLKGLHPDDKQRSHEAAQKAMQPENGGLYENEYRTIGIEDGKLRWVRSKGRIIFDENKNPIRFTGITQDITKQRELIQSLQLQSLVLERMDEGVSVSDENGIILLTNPAEDKMFGYENGELIGKHVTVQNAYDPQQNERIVADVISELKNKGFWNGEWHNRKKDGTDFYTFSYITSLTVNNTNLFVCVQRDITNHKQAEKALHYRNALLEAQNEAIPDALLIVDTKGKMLSFNRHFAELWNIPKEIMDAKDDAAALEFAMKQVADPKKFIDRVNYCYQHPDEKAHEEVPFKDGRLVERWGNAVMGEDGTNFGWIWYFRDVTEQKNAELAIREALETTQRQQRLYEAVTNNTPDLVYVFNLNYRFTYANKSLLTMWGRSAENSIGRGLRELGYENWHAEMHEREIDEIVKTKKSVRGTVSFPHAELGKRVYDYILSPIFNEQGDVEAIAGSTRDITDIKLAEEAIKQSEELFRSFSNNITNLAWIAKADGWIYWYNQRWYDYTGTTLEDMQGWGWEKVHHPHHISRVVEFVKKAWHTPAPYELTFPLRGADGIYRWFLTRVVPVMDEKGNIQRWIGTNTNINEQKLAEENARQSEEQLAFAIDAAELGVWDYSPLTNKFTANNRLKEWFGLQPQEEIDLSLAIDVMESSDRARVANAIQNALQWESGGAYDLEYSIINPSTKQKRIVRAKGKASFNSDRIAYRFNGTLQDVTVQAHARKRIEESEELFRILATSIPQMVWMTDSSGNLEYITKNWEDYTGQNDQDAKISASDLIHSDDRAQVWIAWDKAHAQGNTWKSEYRLKSRNGNYRWFSATMMPLKDASGKILKWIGAATDIHDQKAASEKLEKLVDERTKALQQSNEDLQQFAHVASHDLKEPVRKIKTFTSRLQTEQDEQLDERAKMYIGKIQSATDRIFTMIDGVLKYSTLISSSPIPEKVDLNEVFRNIENDLEVAIQQKSARLQYSSLPVLLGTHILLYQLFYNLVNNSLKFAKANVPPIISVFSKTVVNNNRPMARIILTDNGIGFEQAQASKIFETFVRLHSKDKYEGTGLGLALCKKIAERHGGTIDAESVPGQGATFTILLPLN